ncbi:geranylgeranylglycerol-phosphate geranylgeranyltransferase [Flavobacterium muglaense]|uniref:Geranylgeranylglycerol-phosphate geranylgeranyltransferase n=1 Tax=Flavobacterium muglaense TaxID=2764716 RepID=A0A923N3E4_9FLAO|nr:geranylgeranylglycerol-phosphate geranylgeranyltransferase [Flavobacterium muglaense]MBC5838378.1 geranylgeranylglycerol-phosphate geranylgeranyltransferase [Flavobacterium muglaense]MBC5844913.1 geranylgeranylglycerol-phosphate geranylgeranyltransferase [Flavobacterium muglaense]
MNFLKLIRFQNLLMLAFMQMVFRYGFLKLQNIPLALADWQYFLLVLSTVLIAAAGYVINNIFDQDTDITNKPNAVIVGKTISETAAYNMYVALNVSGVAIGFYISNSIQKPGFAVVFILIATLLYIYATSLKQIMVIGNILVALLLSFSILIIGVFDLYPVVTPSNKPVIAVFFSIILDYAIFAFFINFIREIIKDLEDYDGDYSQGMRTLPIVLGISMTTKLVFALSFVPCIALLYYINNYFMANNLFITAFYALVFILAPIIFFTVKTWTATTKDDFKKLSALLKWILFFGILSILIITLNIKYNAAT